MTTTPGRRRLRPTRIAGVVLPLVAILEIVVIIVVGRAIGAWPTFLLIIATSMLGLWLIRREGSKAFRAFQAAAQSGRMPAREIADGTLVLVGGLMLTGPGFITDVIGLLLVLPFTRPVARNLLTAAITSRVIAQAAVAGADPRVTGRTAGPAFPTAGGPQGARRSESSDEVVQGEIIDDEPPSGTH